MKAYIRALAALLAVMFAVCAFAACGEKPAPLPEESAGGSAQSEPASEPDPGESKAESIPAGDESEPQSGESAADPHASESSEAEHAESKPAEDPHTSGEESRPSESSQGDKETSQGDKDNSKGETSQGGKETSGEVSEVSGEESGEAAETLAPVEVLYCSFSEKPYFAMFGKCEEDATVYAETSQGTVSARSWYGWFSLRLYCSGSSVQVKLWQKTKDGKSAVQTYTAKPKTPGADMWPIVTGSGNYQFFFQKMLPDYKKSNLPTQRQLNALVESTKERVAAVHKYNPEAEVIYLLVPSAMTVYPEYVPEKYVSPSGDSKLELILKALNEGGAYAPDLKKVFLEHKGDEMSLFYHLDSHWADYGAYLAYVELYNHISQKFPAAKPRGVDEFDWVADYYESGDMTYYLSIPQEKVFEYAWFRKFKSGSGAASSITSVPRYRSAKRLAYSTEATYEMNFETYNTKLPNVLVMRDSFSTQIFDLIADRSNKSHFLGMWDESWKRSVVNAEKPDYVIFILAEWNLDSVLKG